MRGPQPFYRIQLTGSQRRQIKRDCRSRTSEARFVQRRRIVLLASVGLDNTHIAERVGCTRETVVFWRRRFIERGLAGLEEEPRSGRPSRISAQERHETIAMACRKPADVGVELSQWSLSSLRKALLDSGRVRQISTTSIWTILNDVDLRPHHFRRWLFSDDPLFDQKMRDIVEVYTVLVAKRGETALCLDEKTGIQILERIQPIVPPAPGYPGLIEGEYIRHGTSCLFACFNVGTGKVLGWNNPTRTQVDWLTFLDKVADAYPTGTVHLVLDNLNTHISEETRKWNERHGSRFVFHFTPTHASWLNQVEIWFGLLQRELLKNSSFGSVEELVFAEHRYIDQWNQHRAHPFEWTWKGYPLRRGRSPLLLLLQEQMRIRFCTDLRMHANVVENHNFVGHTPWREIEPRHAGASRATSDFDCQATFLERTSRPQSGSPLVVVS